MNSESFFNYFINNGLEQEIKGSMSKSEFAITSFKMSDLITAIMSNHKYTTVNCQQNGLPNVNRVKSNRKISYCTNFDIMINNFTTLFVYETVKYLLIRCNMKDFLHNGVEKISTINDFSIFKGFVDDWIKLFSCGSLSVDNQKLIEQLKTTKFYNKYKCRNINEVKSCILTDLRSTEVLHYALIMKEITNILKIVLESSNQNNVIINSINDLLIPETRFDILYTGSFLRMLTKMYDKCDEKKFNEMLIEYEIKKTIDTNFKETIPSWITFNLNKVNSIVTKHNESTDSKVTINVNSQFVNYLSEAIIYYYCVWAINLAHSYDIILGFDKTSRVLFKIIYGTIISTTPTFFEYTPSQKTLIHYVLLTDVQLGKSFNTIHGHHDGEADEETEEA